MEMVLRSGMSKNAHVVSMIDQLLERVMKLTMKPKREKYSRLVIHIPKSTKTISVKNIRTGDTNVYVGLDAGIYQSVHIGNGVSFGEHIIDVSDYLYKIDSMKRHNIKLIDFVSRQMCGVSDVGFPVGVPVIMSIKPASSQATLMVYKKAPTGSDDYYDCHSPLPNWTSCTFRHTASGDIPMVIQVTKVKAEQMKVMWCTRRKHPPLHRFQIGYMSLTNETILRQYMCGLLTSDTTGSCSSPAEFIDRGCFARFWRLMSLLADVSAVNGF